MKTNPEKIFLTKLFGNKRLHTLHFNKTGTRYFHIKVFDGTVQAIHNSYSLDTRNWLDNPKHTKPYQSQHILKAGEEKIIKYEIGKVHEQHDKVFIINHHLFKSASFSIREITD